MHSNKLLLMFCMCAHAFLCIVIFLSYCALLVCVMIRFINPLCAAGYYHTCCAEGLPSLCQETIIVRTVVVHLGIF